jgi:hypothetical protein
MKLYSDLSLNSNDLFEIKTLQLNLFGIGVATPADVAVGTLYFDGNVVDDTNTNDTAIDSSKLVKSGLKLKFKDTTGNSESEWLYFLAGYQYNEGTAPTINLIKRYNLDGGRLLNANTTPRFASELVCKSYVDGLIGGKFTFAIVGDNATTEFVTPTAPAAGAIMGHISTVTLYERSGNGVNGTYSFTVVLADITIETSTTGTVVTNIVKVKFTVAPTSGTYYELRGA